MLLLQSGFQGKEKGDRNDGKVGQAEASSACEDQDRHCLCLNRGHLHEQRVKDIKSSHQLPAEQIKFIKIKKQTKETLRMYDQC